MHLYLSCLEILPLVFLMINVSAYEKQEGAHRDMNTKTAGCASHFIDLFAVTMSLMGHYQKY